MRRLLVAALIALAVVPAVPMAVARAATPADPPLDVPAAQLAASLDCPATFHHPEHEPVLLVHGTFTKGEEQFSWNYDLLLAQRGFDSCVVTYPDRGLGDMQVSAEYVVNAIHTIYARTGRKVGMVGHSQGGLMPRWAIKWWPSVQSELADFVMLASPNHGVAYAPSAHQSPYPLPAVFFQFDPNSHFIAALNAGDETPGNVDYSSIYSTLHDEAVQPDGPVPTAGLDWGHAGPHVKNLAPQEVCPGRLVDHLTIGTTDRLTQELVIDAITHDGPVNPARVAAGAAVRGPRPIRGARPDPRHRQAVPAVVVGRVPRPAPGAQGARARSLHAGGEGVGQQRRRSHAVPPAAASHGAVAAANRTLPATGGRVPVGWATLAAAAGVVMSALGRAEAAASKAVSTFLGSHRRRERARYRARRDGPGRPRPAGGREGAVPARRAAAVAQRRRLPRRTRREPRHHRREGGGARHPAPAGRSPLRRAAGRTGLGAAARPGHAYRAAVLWPTQAAQA